MKNIISIVIPNYNNWRIKKTINSIRKQTTNNYQLIIVEGCLENKGTETIYQKNRDIIDVLIHEKDRGIFDGLNKGVKAADGELIFLLGSDDYLDSKYLLERVLKEYISDDSIDGICVATKILYKEWKLYREWSPKNITKKKMKWGILPPHFSLFLKTSLYDQLGLFNISDGDIACDTEWLLRLAKIENLNIVTIPDLYVMMKGGGTSNSSISNILTAAKKIYIYSKDLGYWNYMFIPFVKLFSKLLQFRFYSGANNNEIWK